MSTRERGWPVPRERGWPVPVALVALSAIPLTVRTLRLAQLAGGPPVLPADHRFDGSPVPLVVHILGATTSALVGILQFVPRFRPALDTDPQPAGAFS